MAKRRAALALSGCTKLLVRYSASLCSPHWLRGTASRTARVSGCSPGGKVPGGKNVSFMAITSLLFLFLGVGQAQARGVLVVLLVGAAPLGLHGRYGFRGNVAGDVVTIEARGLEPGHCRVDAGDSAAHGVKVLKNQCITTNPLADFLFRAAMG